LKPLTLPGGKWGSGTGFYRTYEELKRCFCCSCICFSSFVFIVPMRN